MNLPNPLSANGLSEVSELNNAPALDLLMLVKNLQSNIAQVAEEHGITLMQLYTMHAIGKEHRTMGKMAQAIRCDASNVTGIIDKLVIMGMVTRREDPSDRRIKLLELTPEACALTCKIISALNERLLNARVSAEELTQLSQTLFKLNENFCEV